MTARVLVVDDIPANVRLLETRLTAEYFEVLTASNGPEALEICERDRADVVLLDVMMPGMDGFEVCRRLKANPRTQHVPVVMVTALDGAADKVRGLEVGADDFLSKPVDEIALITRVRNLVRLKLLNDQMRMRATAGDLPGVADPASGLLQADVNGLILLVEDHARNAQRITGMLSAAHRVVVVTDPSAALSTLSGDDFDIALVSLDLQSIDGLRLCSQIRSMEKTRQLPVIMLADPGQEARLLRGLDLGVNDYVMRPIERNELMARVKTQIRRKRHTDYLRNRLEESVEAAITDPLTGLNNRRYMERYMRTLVEQALKHGKPLSMLISDIDHFKLINDRHGHDAGDEVLKEFARRLRSNIRGVDLACRLGGEEFVVIMPDTDMSRACQVAERLRTSTAGEAFELGRSRQAVRVTTSVGVATLESPGDTAEIILQRADRALYSAKREGRNRVATVAA